MTPSKSVRHCGRTGLGEWFRWVSRLLIACAVVLIASTACAEGSGGTTTAPDGPDVTVPEPPDTEVPTDPTRGPTPDAESPRTSGDTTTPESAEPSDGLIREAVEYLYATNPVSFAEGNCFGYGAEADFGAVDDVEVTDRDDPESRTLGLTTGPLTGTSYPVELRVSFSNGRVGDYSAVLFLANPADGGGWYVNVNMCGWYQFA